MNVSSAELDIYKESQIVPYLEGESGIGKTSIIEQYAKEKEMDCIIMGVASLDHIEFYGRTVSTDMVAGIKGKEFTVFNKSIPNWVSKILQNDENNKETLLFIDELNRADFILESAEDDMSDPGMDPRRWDMISRLLYAYEKNDKNSSNLLALLSTVSSKEVTPKLVNYIKESDVLTFSKIQKQLTEFLTLNKEKEFKAYLLEEKSKDSNYLELINSIQSKWDDSQPVTQVNILTASFYALKTQNITEDVFAIILRLSSEEPIMSIKIALDDAQIIINKIDEKYKLGISKKVSDGLIQHIDQTNPFIASLIQV